MKRNLTYIPNVNVKAEEQVESLRRLVAKRKQMMRKSLGSFCRHNIRILTKSY